MIKVFALSITLFFICSCKEKEIDFLEKENSNRELVPKQLWNLAKNCIECGCHWRFEQHKDKDIALEFQKPTFRQTVRNVF